MGLTTVVGSILPLIWAKMRLYYGQPTNCIRVVHGDVNQCIPAWASVWPFTRVSASWGTVCCLGACRKEI